MSALTPASEVLLRHSDDFEESRVLFAGDMQDDLPARLDTAESRAHTQQFHHWQVLSRQLGDNARFSLVAEQADVGDSDTLIYYWPKNKPDVLSGWLASPSPKVRLTLCDVSAPAVEASRATLAANGFEGEVFASNVFSEVTGRYDMIISNPPFHDGLQTSLEAAQTLIRGAVRHLNSGGELRIVANAFLPYPQVLDETFGFHEVLAQTGRFKVYRTVMTRQAKR